ncbi:MAG TPA: asparaginase [Ilumatobacter sp.]|nr:asparaginase [Ilumatobacter sp.]
MTELVVSDAIAQRSYVPLAIVSRSGADESVHFGVAVAFDAAGAVAFSAGDPSLHIYPRSSNKPMQADAMLALGVELDDRQLALACASHAGTPTHLAVVESTLASVGLDVSALENTPAWPLSQSAASGAIAAGASESSLMQNCSGKHAAMLATCVHNGWPTDGYCDLDHPLQVAVTAHLDELVGGTSHIGIDGCGAPAHMMTLAGLATGFGTLARSGGRVAQAMSGHPELVGGFGRDVTRLMQLVPGLVAKDGADGVFAAALPDGRCAAIKLSDGASRASGVVIAATLRAIGVEIDPSELGAPIEGHGQPVGAVRPADVFGVTDGV